jgi:tetratricopeptide (TPR) repeat protein
MAKSLGWILLTLGALSAAAGQRVSQTAPPGPPAGVDVASPVAIRAFLDAYSSGDTTAIDRWIAGAGPDRNLLPFGEAMHNAFSNDLRAAAFLLEVAYREPLRASSFLRLGRSIVVGRPHALGVDRSKDRFELLWHQSAIAVAQTQAQVAILIESVDAAHHRLAQAQAQGLAVDTRIPLAQAQAAAIGCCWKRIPGAAVRSIPAKAKRSIDEALALFRAAATIESSKAEALVRGAALLAGERRYTEALSWLADVPRHDDTFVAYVQYMTLARVYEQLDRIPEAAAAYANALDRAPNSQSAAIGLAAALIRTGRTEDGWKAATQARRMTEIGEPGLADWERGDARFLPRWLAEIRGLMQ